MERKQITKRQSFNSLSPLISKETSDFAKDRGILPEVKKAYSWMKKKVGRCFSGSVAIGKGYSTLLLDVSYQDGTVSVSCDTCKIKFKGVEVNSAKEFNAEFDKHYELIEE